MTYQYTHGQVWLDPLTAERDPHGYDLCRRHADRLTAPQGWQVGDRRRQIESPAAAAEPVMLDPVYIAVAV